MREILAEHVPVLSAKNPFEIGLDGRRYYVCMKNISYLGFPHPEHKKRIQIPGSWQETLRKENSFLVGLYSYGGRNLFVLFDTARYRKNRLNNSSAHVHAIDLLSGDRYGTFEKVDKGGNRILVLREDRLKDTLLRIARGDRILLSPELSVVDAFAKEVPSRWKGKESYAEMQREGFPDALQPEWPGFYLEYRFSRFLAASPDTYGRLCAYVKDKRSGSLDFDLDFRQFLGDLKMHDHSSSAVLGNDLASVNAALDRDGRLWYVVASSRSVKDRDKGFEVTRYWNGLLNSRDGSGKSELSYGNRMKNEVALTEVVVAEINRANRKYLKEFAQGLNSNGTQRCMKAKIAKRDMDNFVIYRKSIAS
jgi:hypothetical protein